MAFFKTDEEKLKEAEDKILKEKEFVGRVGSTHTGWDFVDGFRNMDKIRFNITKFKIYEDKLMIERHRNFIKFCDMKEIFQETEYEALIILNNEDIIPIKGKSGDKKGRIGLKAFINVLNNLIKNNVSDINNKENKTSERLEDKFDKLIKLGEMHDKGLLSDEEFDSLKQELLGNNEDTTSTNENNVGFSSNTCENCGADVSPDDEFCSECGTQIN